MAFMPFLGGRRVCAGKSFAEIVMRLLTATLISKFGFEFVNQKDMMKDHYIQISHFEKFEKMVRIKPKQL